jgi:hypothetical protein
MAAKRLVREVGSWQLAVGSWQLAVGRKTIEQRN